MYDIYLERALNTWDLQRKHNEVKHYVIVKSMRKEYLHTLDPLASNLGNFRQVRALQRACMNSKHYLYFATIAHHKEGPVQLNEHGEAVLGSLGASNPLYPFEDGKVEREYWTIERLHAVDNGQVFQKLNWGEEDELDEIPLDSDDINDKANCKEKAHPNSAYAGEDGILHHMWQHAVRLDV
ncbi:hypothetical protein BDV95DRAFT_70776 [Massariosphaeria phaeospora]|uniref:Uncharacterized protein n=1 Tax=Massariosphaeria phaeospora TaxID=100035 RepID=A0A7C8I8M2_9PLEO|nr:hypothetical protein BDV95DRAFT_70776 [Massariosphaeria phaeospora]